MKEIAKRPRMGILLLLAGCALFIGVLGFLFFRPVEIADGQNGILGVDVLYFPQWNVSDGGISYQSSAEETALRYRALSETKFRRRLFSGPYTPPEEASYCFVAMTGEREHFFLDLYCTEDKVTLQVQTSSGTYQAIDPEKIYDVLAPHFPIE